MVAITSFSQSGPFHKPCSSSSSRLWRSSHLLTGSPRKGLLRQAPHVRESQQFLLTIVSKVSAKSSAMPLEEELSNGEDLLKWRAAREPLLRLPFSDEEADRILSKSFGWSPSPFWGEERKKTMPDPALVQKTLDFLHGVGLSDADLPGFLKKFPEVLGCLVEEEMQKNVQILEKEWGISGGMLRNLLLRNPKVLGYNVDCKGDCMAQCTRCWVRF